MVEPLEARRLLAAGDLVQGFGSDGWAEVPFDNRPFQIAAEVIETSDGSIYVLGLTAEFGSGQPLLGVTLPALRQSTDHFSSEVFAAKLTPDGQLDSSYFGDGIAAGSELDWGLPIAHRPFDLRPAPDGGFFALARDQVPIGPNATTSTLNVLKLTPELQRDTGFGFNGWARLPDVGVDHSIDYVPLQDGGVAVLARAFTTLPTVRFPHRVYVFNAAGEVTGQTQVESAIGYPDILLGSNAGIAVDGVGRIYVGFGADTTQTTQDPHLARLIRFNPNLALDTTYGSGGLATASSPGERQGRLILSSDGRAAMVSAQPRVRFFDPSGQHVGPTVQLSRDVDVPIGEPLGGHRIVTGQFGSDDSLTLAIAASSSATPAVFGNAIGSSANIQDTHNVGFVVRVGSDHQIDLTLSQGAVTFFSQTQPFTFTDAAFTSSGNMLIAGSDEFITYDTSGPQPIVAGYERSASVRLLDLSGPGVTVNVHFEDAPSVIPEGVIERHGYVFRSEHGGGISGSTDPLQFPSFQQGYPSKVLQPLNWGRKVTVQRQDGAAFDLDSFQFAQNQYGDQADFVVTGLFADGTTQVRNVTISMAKWMDELDLSWTGLARVEINYAGGINPAMSVLDNFVVRRSTVPGGNVVVDFESAPVGPISSGIYSEQGFTFSNLHGSGGSNVEPLHVFGPAQGYASKVIHPANWGRKIEVKRQDATPFSLASFDYAASRYGDAGDFILTGRFADGSTQTQTVPFSGSKQMKTLTLNWQNLISVDVNYAGGVNGAYGALDNFVFGASQGTGAYQFQGNRVVMEAEGFDRNIPRGAHAWSPFADGTMVGGGLQALPDSGVRYETWNQTAGPELQYSINFPAAGTYYVWLRGKGAPATYLESDSAWVGLNGAGTSQGITRFNTGASLSETTWSNYIPGGGRAQLTVASAGVHTFNVWMREDGFILDRVLITSDAGYTPTGQGPPASPRG